MAVSSKSKSLCRPAFAVWPLMNGPGHLGGRCPGTRQTHNETADKLEPETNCLEAAAIKYRSLTQIVARAAIEPPRADPAPHHPIFGGTFAFRRNRLFGSNLALRATSRSKLAP